MFWKKHPKKFLSEEEQKMIQKEIRQAEEGTSGEIRIHLDRHAGKDPLEKAKKIFQQMGMMRTKHRNAILIYLATDHRKFAIVGDEGINQVVPENYWEEIKDEMQKHFRENKFGEGLCLGIRRIGEKLKSHFPPDKINENELPNEISGSG